MPKLKNTPSEASKLIKDGMNIKDNYKKIISESTLSAVDKAKAMGIIGLNVVQMTKIGPLVKKNCEKVKMYGEDIKESSEKLVSDKKKIEDIGKKCNDEGLETPLDCHNKYGETPKPPKPDNEDNDWGLGSLTKLAKSYAK